MAPDKHAWGLTRSGVWDSLCTPQRPATKKGEAILRQGHHSPTRTTSIHHRDRGCSTRSETYRGGETRNEAIWRGSSGDPEVPQWPHTPATLDEGVRRGQEEAGPGTSRTSWSLPWLEHPGDLLPGAPSHPSSSSSPPASWLFTRGAACQQRKCILFPAQEFTTITWAVAK